MSSVLDAAKELVAPLAEKALKKAVNEKYDSAFDKIQADIKAKVKPEQVQDFLQMLGDVVQPKLKEYLLDGIDKIDGVEGN